MPYLLIAAATFGLMFLLDKGLTRLFRSREQHRTGTAVRLPKHYGIFSLALMILGLLGLIFGITEPSPMLAVGGILLIPGGALLGIYYLTHGIFYDRDTFLYTTIGNRSRTCRYGDIRAQKLFQLQGGSYMVELYMTDGTSVSVQTAMPGALDFLDHASHARMRHLGLNSHECGWYEPDKCSWFPSEEE